MAGAGHPPPALPAPYAWSLPSSWRRVDFISDLHLAPTLPHTFHAWAQHLLHTPADAVLMLGDVFEVWVGDDQREGVFEQQCVHVLAEAASRRHVGFMPGNRDFLLGHAMRRDCGVMALADPTVLDAWGQRLLLTHGDALCLDDVEYQRFRTLSRSEAWQRQFAALPLSERLARAHAARGESERRRLDHPNDPARWADVDDAAAVAWMHAAGCGEMIHGHTHRPATHTLAPGYTRHVLTDWDLDHDGPGRAEVLRLTREGLARVAPSTAG